MDRWIDRVLRYRIGIILAVLLVSVPLVVSVTTLRSQDTYDGWFAADDPTYRFYQTFQSRFANDMFIMAAFRDDPLITPANIAIIRDLTARLEAMPRIRQVTSLTNVEFIRGSADQLVVEPLVREDEMLDEVTIARIGERAQSRPLYRDVLISGDGTTTAVVAELERVDGMNEEMAVVASVRGILDELTAETGKRFHLGGYPVMDVDVMQASERDVRTFIPLTLLLIVVALWVLFRRVAPVAFGLIVVALTLLWTFGIYAGAGNEYSMMMSIVPVLLIAIGIADAVHILVHYYEELRQGRAQLDALKRTLRQKARPCLFTTLTTGVGFISFLASDIPIVRLTGVYAALGIGLAFLLSVIVLPALLSLTRPPRQAAQSQSSGRLETLLAGIDRLTLPRPRAILIGALVVGVMGAWGATQLVAETSWLELLRVGHPLQRDYEFIETNLTGLSNLEIVVEGERDVLRTPETLHKLDRLSAFALAQPGVRKTLSPVDHVKAINRALHGDDPAFYRIPDDPRQVAQSLLLYEFSGGNELRDYVTGDYASGRLSVLAETTSSRESSALKARIVDYAEDELDLSVRTTGTVALVEAMMAKVASSQIKSLAIALGLITVLMALLLGSIRLALISLIPNALPIFLMFGVMGWTGIPLDTATSIVAGLALGIAVDDTIHFLTRFRCELRTTPNYRDALARTTRSVGRAIVSTSVILTVGFSVLLLGSFQGTVYLGLLTGLTMAFAVASDLVLLPALLLWLRPIKQEAVAERAQRHSAIPIGGEEG